MPQSERHYDPAKCAVFFRVRDAFGGLSNMAGGFPLQVGEVILGSSEAYYQAIRWPHRPDIQADIIAEASPLMAKRVAYRYLSEARPDWETARIAVMRLALRIKFSQHRHRINALFERSGDLAIVEQSSRDPFWGAIPGPDGVLHGKNVLGRLWMELRREVRGDPQAYRHGVMDVTLPDHILLGREIRTIPAPEAQDPVCATSRGTMADLPRQSGLDF